MTRRFFALLTLALLWQSMTVHAKVYFQQNVRYSLDVTLDDHSHVLRGQERLVYTNNSPDTLSVLFIHLWPNAYRDENTVLAKQYFNDMDNRFIRNNPSGLGGIDSLDFVVDGVRVTWSYLPDTLDVAFLQLNNPLMPGDSLLLETPFRMKFPDAGISRLGHAGQAYYATQWYPKPAVYDRGGWKYFPYVDKGEYYGEFGTFDVRLTLPDNYVVGSTGELVDGTQEIEWLNGKVLETMSMTEFQSDSLSFPASSLTYKTLHYHQDRIHDFAWFADKRWHVLKSSTELPGSRERVTIWAFFTNQRAKLWMKAPDYMERAVQAYSRWLGDYPYASVTAVDVLGAEGSNMEYPMVTAIGTVSSAYDLDGVLAHELGHNWLYGILGSDERRHPWMDEGINSFYEKRYLLQTYANDSTRLNEYFNRMGRWGKWTKSTRMNARLKQYWRYLGDARLNSDQAPDTRSECFTLRNYSDMVYAKTSLGFQYAWQSMGDSLFDSCMREYYERWKFKHPEPADLRESLESCSRNNLSWLFEDWISSTRKLDYTVTDLTVEPVAFDVSFHNSGGIPGPVGIKRINKDGISETVWVTGFTGDTTIHLSGKPASRRLIDAEEWMPEINRKNNSIRESGILRRLEPLQLKWLTGRENPDRTTLYVAPAAGWNLYNSVMLGGVLHNVGYPAKGFEFALMPLFALGSKDLAGGGFVSYHLLPYSTIFKDITFRSGIQRYAYDQYEYSKDSLSLTQDFRLHFIRVENSISFDFFDPAPRRHTSKNLTLRHLFISKEEQTSPSAEPSAVSDHFFEAKFTHQNTNTWNGFKHSLTVTGNQDFCRIWAEGSHRFPYANPVKGFSIGISGGYLTYDGINDYRLRLSGRTGSQDYLFDDVFLGRSESSGVLSQQFLAEDGGFGINTGYYRYAEQWMAVLHIKADFPGKLPVAAYVNLGTFDKADRYSPADAPVSAEGGVEISLIKDIFKVYVPLVYSNDIQYAVDREGLDFGERIRFELRIKKLNPLDNLNRR